MDKTTLVRSDVEIGGLVMDALSRLKIPVTLCDWNYVHELDEWQLIIATPWYDSKGPRETYSRIIDAFQQAGIYQDVPMRRVFLKSPQDGLVKSLEQELKQRAEGFLHLLRHGNGQYSVIVAPISGRGGAVPARHFPGISELREFLEKELRLRPSSIEDAIGELQQRGSTSIYPFRFGARHLKRLGLVA